MSVRVKRRESASASPRSGKRVCLLKYVWSSAAVPHLHSSQRGEREEATGSPHEFSAAPKPTIVQLEGVQGAKVSLQADLAFSS